MELPIHYQKTVLSLWYSAIFGYVFRCKKSHPLMFLLFLPLVVPGCLFKAMLACLVVFKSVFVLSGLGVNLLMFLLPLMLQVPGHLVLGVALVCICYFTYKAILQVCRSFEFEPWTATTLITYIIWLIYDECYIILHICGLVTYAMLYLMLSYLPSMLVLMPWVGQNVMEQVIVITLLVYNRWCCLAAGNGEQFFCCKTTNIFPVSPEEEREILKNQKRKTSDSELTEKPEKQLTDKTTVEPRPETSQQASREKEIQNIRRSILTTNLTKENVKDMWLKKQSRRGRRRWSRISNNALSVSVSRVSKDW